MTASSSRARAWLLGLGTSLGLLSACGDKKPAAVPPGAAAEVAVDADPIALLPQGALAIARIDARALVKAGETGPQLGVYADRFFPLADATGAKPSRDLETAWVATYSYSGADLVSLLRGKVDEAGVRKLAETHTPLKNGDTLTAVDYMGSRLYTTKLGAFTFVTPQTTAVGSETLVRRVMERVKDKRVARDPSAFITGVLDAAPAATFVGAADFASQPVGQVAVGMMPLPWAQGISKAKVIVEAKDARVTASARLTYAEPARAAQAAEQLKKTSQMAVLMAAIGAPPLRDLQIKSEANDVSLGLYVEDKPLAKFLGSLEQYLKPAAF
jgi:hypothetical protein